MQMSKNYLMLGTIRDFIDTLDDSTFEEFYVEYIMYMQNVAMQNEFNYLIKHNQLNALNLIKLINSETDRMVEI